MNAIFIQALVDLLGSAQVLQDSDCAAFETDWRKRYTGKALAVVFPNSPQQVAAVVTLCAQHQVSIVPQGGHTGLVGGGTPNTTGQQLVLNLTRINRIRTIDPENLCLIAEAGCVLQTVQEAARAAGLWFPLSLAAEGSCTIGGNLATNAGGTQVLRFGNARDLCLGLEVVTPQGEIIHTLKALRKDNTGYDLRHLYLGSEGTLGIITAATLKLYPLPAATVCALVQCHDMQQAVHLLRLSRQHLQSTLTGFEVMNDTARQLVHKHFPTIAQPLPILNPSQGETWAVLIELSDEESATHGQDRLEVLLRLALEQGIITDAAIATSIAQIKNLWHLRESIPLAQAAEGLNIKHDIAVPISQIAAFVAHMKPAIEAHCPGAQFVTFGHLGDGNLHYNVQAPRGMPAADFLKNFEPTINRLVYDRVTQMQGSISAEHGIGELKREELAQYADPIALSVMKKIKLALDPQGIMNPGRIF
jgi:FAD/FMN-containing dehydrogenase